VSWLGSANAGKKDATIGVIAAVLIVFLVFFSTVFSAYKSLMTGVGNATSAIPTPPETNDPIGQAFYNNYYTMDSLLSDFVSFFSNVYVFIFLIIIGVVTYIFTGRE
jgi:uncharacterized membrane protein